jgi:hypothetical protein
MPDESSQEQRQIAARFADYASQYCTFVQNCGDLTPYEFVVRALNVLATLQREAIALPEIHEIVGTRDASVSIDIPTEQIHAVTGPISEKLGKHDFYLLVFDPTDHEDTDRPVGSSISGDLADIYVDVKRGLLAFQQPESYATGDVLWTWKFNFIHHWGRHLADAQRTLFFLISNYMVTPDNR